MGRPAPDAGSDLILERLKTLHPKIIDLSLGRIERLLAALGHPERNLPPVVHAAGTNGKGSTLAFLQAMLEAAGYRVHVYVSPHLVRFHERIRLAGALIPEDRLSALLEECEIANAGAPITFFEITTAAAFLAFARTPADALLLETGLGGRLDATNVIDRPALTIITPISPDHHQYLGDSLEGIAVEKAGILKPGVPAVIGRQKDAVLDVLSARGREIGAPLLRLGHEWRADAVGAGARVSGADWSLDLPAAALAGAHQADNAALAAAAAKSLDGVAIGDAAIAAGVRNVDWPGRLQRLADGLLVDGLPRDWQLWLDGGHNAAAGAVLAAQAGAWSRQDGRPLHLVFGMLNSKAPGDFLAPLARYAGAVRAVAVPGEPATLTPEYAAEAARAAGLDARPAESVRAAVQDIVRTAPGPARVLICGSLYLAGSVLRENAQPPNENPAGAAGLSR